MGYLIIDIKTIFNLFNICNLVIVIMLFLYGISTNFEKLFKYYFFGKLSQLVGVIIISYFGMFFEKYLLSVGEFLHFLGISIETYCIIFVGKKQDNKISMIYFSLSMLFILLFLLLIYFFGNTIFDLKRILLSIIGGGFLIVSGTALFFFNNNTKLKKFSGLFFYLMVIPHIFIVFKVVFHDSIFSLISNTLIQPLFFLFGFMQIILSAMTYLLLHREEIYIELKNAATKDFLTGIHNRKEFLLLSTMMYNLMIRQKNNVSLLMLDLDKFKKINDKYGHATGDEVIIHFTKSVNAIIRKQDIFGRYGGEEFILFLPNTSRHEAGLIAERIRSNIENGGIVDLKIIRYTVSIGGISILSENIITMEELIRIADKFLYEAKQKGRNMVVLKNITSSYIHMNSF